MNDKNGLEYFQFLVQEKTKELLELNDLFKRRETNLEILSEKREINLEILNDMICLQNLVSKILKLNFSSNSKLQGSIAKLQESINSLQGKNIFLFKNKIIKLNN